ncbi:retrovirus-related pol polyprotein from transposon TNT 1-94 [Tanacetum coccineum]
MSSIRVVHGLAASMDLKVQQLDVTTPFLHGDLEEEIYMDQLKGFKVKVKESIIWKLKKSLYGLKPAPRKAKKLWISQEMYIEKILERFITHKEKSVGTPLAKNFKLRKKQCPSSIEKSLKMKRVPYASAVGSLMYATVCIRLDLTHAVGVVSRYHWIRDALESKMFNIEKVHTYLNGVDMMTKTLPISKHDTCYEISCMMESST